MGVVGPYFQYISSSPRASTDRYISSSKIGYLSLDSAAPNRCGIIFSNVAEQRVLVFKSKVEMPHSTRPAHNDDTGRGPAA